MKLFTELSMSFSSNDAFGWMGGSARVQVPVQEIRFGLASHLGQLSLAITIWVVTGGSAVQLGSKGRYGTYTN